MLLLLEVLYQQCLEEHHRPAAIRHRVADFKMYEPIEVQDSERKGLPVVEL